MLMNYLRIGIATFVYLAPVGFFPMLVESLQYLYNY